MTDKNKSISTLVIGKDNGNLQTIIKFILEKNNVDLCPGADTRANIGGGGERGEGSLLL